MCFKQAMVLAFFAPLLGLKRYCTMFCLTHHYTLLSRSMCGVPYYSCYRGVAAWSKMAADRTHVDPLLHCQSKCAQSLQRSLQVQVQCFCKCFSSSSSNGSSKSSRGHSQWECLVTLDPWACLALLSHWACNKPSPLWARPSGQPCLPSRLAEEVCPNTAH